MTGRDETFLVGVRFVVAVLVPCFGALLHILVLVLFVLFRNDAIIQRLRHVLQCGMLTS